MAGQQITGISTGTGGEGIYVSTADNLTAKGCADGRALLPLTNPMLDQNLAILLSAYSLGSQVVLTVDGCSGNDMLLKAVSLSSSSEQSSSATYATLNEQTKHANMSLVGTEIHMSTSTWGKIYGDIGHQTGKHTYEVEFVSGNPGYIGFGIGSDVTEVDGYTGDDPNTYAYLGDGRRTNNNQAISISLPMSIGQKALILADLDSGTLDIIVDGSAVTSLSTTLPSATYYPVIGTLGSGVVKVNFGDSAFTNTVPAGYEAGWKQ